MKISLSIFLIILSIGCRNGNHEKNSTMEIDNQDISIYSRDEFEEIFYGKPRDFIEKRLGTADEEQELFSINVSWLWYKSKTYSANPETPDEWVKLRFDDFAVGKVDRINYE